MGQLALALLLILGLGGLAAMFGWNVRRGLCTGEIWAKNVRIYRVEQPVGFWITVFIYVAAVLFCVGGVGAIISFYRQADDGGRDGFPATISKTCQMVLHQTTPFPLADCWWAGEEPGRSRPVVAAQNAIGNARKRT